MMSHDERLCMREANEKANAVRDTKKRKKRKLEELIAKYKRKRNDTVRVSDVIRDLNELQNMKSK